MRPSADRSFEWRMVATIAPVRQKSRAACGNFATAVPAPQLRRVPSQLRRQGWAA